jgi:hypothetical protein
VAGRPQYTAKRFIAAMPGTGGVISQIARAVGCDWHTAKRYIEEHPTVKLAWEAERNSITDRARWHVLKAIEEGDLPTCKWWLQVMDEEFTPKASVNTDGRLIIEYVNDWRASGDDTTP